MSIRRGSPAANAVRVRASANAAAAPAASGNGHARLSTVRAPRGAPRGRQTRVNSAKQPGGRSTRSSTGGVSSSPVSTSPQSCSFTT